MKTVIILLLSVATTWACNPITTVQNTVEHIASKGCDCSYRTGGCKISQAAPPLFACKCKLDGPFTCSGSKTQCKDVWSLKCLQPDTSLDSCVEGQGDCGGYDCKCGVPLATRSVKTKIIGGQNALPNEFPWQVLLTKDDGTDPVCSGILLSSRSILTNPGCKDFYPTKAFVGVYDRTTTPMPADVQSFTIYDATSWTTDQELSIITLAGPVKFTSNVYPVCLPSAGSIYSNTEGVVTGWGLTDSNDGTSWSSILQKLTQTTMTNAVCTTLAGSVVTDLKICAAAANKGACDNDWGGPLITMNPTSGRYEVIGIALSTGCAGQSYSGADIYARVTRALPWIQTTIAGVTCSG